jgi:protein-S-isoprenylcysteine O-methyltransferase Ste14
MTGWGGLAFVYHIASRLAYVVGVGVALSRQDREQIFTRRDGVEAGFRRFRRMAATVMNNDGVSFVLLCFVTRQTIHLAPAVLLTGGGALILLGVSTKLWAAARLGSAAYYWHNFFAPGELVAPDPPGPYRYFKNPMYTVGNLHMYGAALVLGSLPGLVAAAFDQAAIMTFYRLVEKPHFDALTRRGPAGPTAVPAGGSASG